MAKVRKVFLKNLQNNAKITDNAFSDGLFSVGVGIILEPE